MTVAEVTRISDTDGVDDDARIVTKIHRWITEGSDWCKDDHDRAEENQDYCSGHDMWRQGDLEAQEAKGRPALIMNKVLNMVNAVSNREIMQRFQPKVYAREANDKGIATALDEAIRWQRDKSETEHEESLAFRALVITGYAVMHKFYDGMSDMGNGLIEDEEIPIWEMLWDSRARKQNLIDRRWHVRGRWVARIEAEEEFGDISVAARKMFDQYDKFAQGAEDSNTFFHNSSGSGRWPWDNISAGKWYNRTDDEIFLVEAEWVEAKTEFKAAIPVRIQDYYELVSNPEAEIPLPDPTAQPDPETGQPPEPPMITGAMYAEMQPDMQAQVDQQLLSDTKMEVFESRKELNEFLTVYFEITGEEFVDWVKFKRYEWRYAFVSDDVVLDQGERPEGFTYEFMTGFPHVNRAGTRWFGLVDVAKGPQDWRNAFMSLILTRLAQSPKQTLLIEESAVEDLDTFFDQLANPRGAVVVPDGFVQGNRYMTLQPPTFPPMERELLVMADQAVQEVAGLSGLDTGAQTDLRRISGTVAQQVKQASNTIIALLFDALRRYRKRFSLLTLRFLTNYYTTEEIIRVIGEEHAEHMGQIEDFSDIERFDIKLDETETSVTERQEFFDYMTRTGTLENWISEGLLPFEIVLDWNPWISESDKAKILEHQENKAVEAQKVAEEDAQKARDEAMALKQTVANAGPEAQQALIKHDAQQIANREPGEEPPAPPEGGAPQ